MSIQSLCVSVFRWIWWGNLQRQKKNVASVMSLKTTSSLCLPIPPKLPVFDILFLLVASIALIIPFILFTVRHRAFCGLRLQWLHHFIGDIFVRSTSTQDRDAAVGIWRLLEVPLQIQTRQMPECRENCEHVRFECPRQAFLAASTLIVHWWRFPSDLPIQFLSWIQSACQPQSTPSAPLLTSKVRRYMRDMRVSVTFSSFLWSISWHILVVNNASK